MTYAVLAVLAFAASYILGGNRTGISQKESASDGLSIAPNVYADVPYSEASYYGQASYGGGSEGSGEGGSEGSGGGSSSGG